MFLLFTDFSDGSGWCCRGRFLTLVLAREHAVVLLSDLLCHEAHICDTNENMVVLDLYSHRDADGLHITSEEAERIVH